MALALALAFAHLDPCSETQEHMGRVDTGRDGEISGKSVLVVRLPER